MKVTTLLVLFVAMALSVLVIATGQNEPATGLVMVPEGPYTFAEREAAMFPDSPHWIIRGFQDQGLQIYAILLVIFGFSAFCTWQTIHAAVTGQNVARMPFVAAAGLLPVWIGVCLTFWMLRLLPHYAGHPSYHHNHLGTIRVALFTSLASGLLPAAIAMFALWRHSSRISSLDPPVR